MLRDKHKVKVKVCRKSEKRRRTHWDPKHYPLIIGGKGLNFSLNKNSNPEEISKNDQNNQKLK